MAYFPMFINLENKKVIVLGGGKTALRKINSLISLTVRSQLSHRESAMRSRQYRESVYMSRI